MKGTIDTILLAGGYLFAGFCVQSVLRREGFVYTLAAYGVSCAIAAAMLAFATAAWFAWMLFA